mgnify:CR=1 FL=1
MTKKSLLGSVQQTMRATEQKKTTNRFDAADDIISNRVKNTESEITKKIKQKLIHKKKLVNLYEQDSLAINKITEKFMLMKTKTTENDILRMGLMVLTGLSDDELLDIYNTINNQDI